MYSWKGRITLQHIIQGLIPFTHQEECCCQEQAFPSHVQIRIVEVNVCRVAGVISVPGSCDTAHLFPLTTHGEYPEMRLLRKTPGQ